MYYINSFVFKIHNSLYIKIYDGDLEPPLTISLIFTPDFARRVQILLGPDSQGQIGLII